VRSCHTYGLARAPNHSVNYTIILYRVACLIGLWGTVSSVTASTTEELSAWRKEAATLIAECKLLTSAQGVMYFDGPDVDKAWRAVALQSRAINARPSDGELWADRAISYYFLRQLELAQRDCTIATAALPENGRAWIHQAYIVDRMINVDFAAAARSMDRAKAAGANPSEYFSYAADLYIHWGKPELAIPLAEAGRAVDPAATIHTLNLGHALLFTGKKQEARALYAQVLSLPAEQGLNGAEFILHDYQMILARGAVKYPEIAESADWVRAFRQKQP
jgi:tetratricopeptide (TPR) repeat protein